MPKGSVRCTALSQGLPAIHYFGDNTGLEGRELVQPLLRSFPCPTCRLRNLQRAASLCFMCKGQDVLSFPCLPRQESLWPWHRHVEHMDSRPVVEEGSMGADVES